MEEEYCHLDMKHSSSHSLELDVYIKALQLGLEYQGEQHYYPMYWSAGNWENQMNRDNEKKMICKQHNITLIQVPYWWDGTTHSLAATIHQRRSDICSVPPGATPIPSEPPQTTKEPKISHGYSWDRSQDVTGWYCIHLRFP